MKLIKSCACRIYSDRLFKCRYFFYFMSAFMSALFHNLENQDELWNFTFANNIANGLLPYRDFNLLQTPFSCLINAVFITIFGHHLVVIRMTGALLFTAICVMAEKCSVKLGAKGVYAMFVPAVFLCMFFWNVFLEYSCLIVFFVLCFIWFDLSMSEGRKFSLPVHLFIGIMGGCAMMCKQTFGTFVAVASWISAFFICVKRKDDYSLRDAFKALLFRMLGSFTVCFIFLVYLLVTGTFSDFWDMAVAGISSFSSSYSYISFMKENPAYLFLGFLLPALGIFAVFIMQKYKNTIRARKTFTVFLYSLFSCINMYPMANSYHVMTCSIPILLLLFAVMPEKFFESRVTKICAFSSELGILVFLTVISPVDDAYWYDMVTDIPGLEFTFMNEEEHEEICQVDAFVREKNEQNTMVYILDNFAPLYFIPSNQYHMYFDMFLIGNLGTKTPEWCLENAADENAIFLIPGDDRGQYQYPYAAVDKFVKKLTEIQKVGCFYAYQ